MSYTACEFVGGPLDGTKRAVPLYRGEPLPKYYVNAVPPVCIGDFDPFAKVEPVTVKRHCYILRDDGKYEHVE